MPFSSLWQTLARLWYVTLAGLILTIGLGYAATIAVPVQYEAQSRVLLIQKTLTGASAGLNPYLGISGLTGFTDVVSRAMTDTATVEDLRAGGLTGTYTAVRDLTTNGSVMLVTVSASSESAAVGDLDLIVKAIPDALSKLQTDVGVQPEAMVSAQVITQDTKATVARKSQIRAMVVALAVGAFGTIVAAVLIDRWRGRRDRPGPPDRSDPDPLFRLKTGNGVMPSQLSGRSNEGSDPIAGRSREHSGRRALSRRLS